MMRKHKSFDIAMVKIGEESEMPNLVFANNITM